RTDVIFGATRAARHSPAAQGGELAGMLINTVPMRVTVDSGEELIPWLRRIREHWIALREFEHSPLDRICEWSGLRPGTPPYDTVVVYEHQSLADSMKQLGGDWANRNLRRAHRTDSALTLIAFGKPVLTLGIVYDERVFSRACAAALNNNVRTVIE